MLEIQGSSEERRYKLKLKRGIKESMQDGSAVEVLAVKSCSLHSIPFY